MDDQENLSEFVSSLEEQTTVEARMLKIAKLSNEELSYFFQALHAPVIVDDRWLPLLQDEMHRRGLVRPS